MGTNVHLNSIMALEEYLQPFNDEVQILIEMCSFDSDSQKQKTYSEMQSIAEDDMPAHLNNFKQAIKDSYKTSEDSDEDDNEDGMYEEERSEVSNNNDKTVADLEGSVEILDSYITTLADELDATVENSFEIGVVSSTLSSIGTQLTTIYSDLGDEQKVKDAYSELTSDHKRLKSHLNTIEQEREEDEKKQKLARCKSLCDELKGGVKLSSQARENAQIFIGGAVSSINALEDILQDEKLDVEDLRVELSNLNSSYQSIMDWYGTWRQNA